MNNFSKLIKSKVISFNEVIIESYKQLGLDEADTMILIHLHNQLLNNNNLLSITNLATKVTLSENDLSTRVLLLVQKGFLELLIGDDSQETFSLDDTYEKLGNMINHEDMNPISRKDQIRQIINYIETTFQAVIKPNEVEIINAWIDEKYTFEEIKEATLECLRMGKPYIQYVDRKLVNSLTQAPVETVDERTFNLLNKIFSKKINVEPHKAYFGNILDNNEIIDEVIIMFFVLLGF